MKVARQFWFFLLESCVLIIGLTSSVEGDIIVQCDDYGPPPFTLEYLHLTDASGSYQNDIRELRRHMPTLLQNLSVTFPGSKFGLASFIDKPLFPFGVSHWMRRDDYCYKLHSKLSSNLDVFLQELDHFWIGDGGDHLEDQLESLMHAALSNEAGWSSEYDDEGRPIVRIIGLSTDAKYHEAQSVHLRWPWKLYANNGDAVLDCEHEDYPTVNQVKESLQSRGIIPLFLVTGRVKHHYEELLRKMDLFGVVSEIRNDSSDIIKAIQEGLETIVCRTTTSTSTTYQISSITEIETSTMTSLNSSSESTSTITSLNSSTNLEESTSTITSLNSSTNLEEATSTITSFKSSPDSTSSFFVVSTSSSNPTEEQGNDGIMIAGVSALAAAAGVVAVAIIGYSSYGVFTEESTSAPLVAVEDVAPSFEGLRSVEREVETEVTLDQFV